MIGQVRRLNQLVRIDGAYDTCDFVLAALIGIPTTASAQPLDIDDESVSALSETLRTT